jgi:MazG family protein
MTTRQQTSRMQELLAIMARLRAADGCPWDREQTPASLVPHTIEEAYEVADAVERGDMQHLKDELGDLLFQVVFQAQIAQETQHFDFEAVAGAICDKLRRRHPHVFGEQTPAAAANHGLLTAAEQTVVWEDIKARERAAAAASAGLDGSGAGLDGEDAKCAPAVSQLDGVPQALPALIRACKLSNRAARVGFDFEQAGQTADKVTEELAEVREAAARDAAARAATARAAAAAASPTTNPSAEVFEEIGDLLFAAANLARKLGVDAEAALRSANAKFERRFRGMESLAMQRGLKFRELSLEAQERLWQEVKRGE